jgi:hypothetical protein
MILVIFPSKPGIIKKDFFAFLSKQLLLQIQVLIILLFLPIAMVSAGLLLFSASKPGVSVSGGHKTDTDIITFQLADASASEKPIIPNFVMQ